jgi:hypothetical protein
VSKTKKPELARAGSKRAAQPPALAGACHCGAVRLEALRAPRQLTDCNCSICRRYGALWAYYSQKTARVRSARGATSAYTRPGGRLEFHHCVRCGCLTHYSSGARLALNARMFPPEELAGVRVRRLDGAKSWRVMERAPLARLVISSARSAASRASRSR